MIKFEEHEESPTAVAESPIGIIVLDRLPTPQPPRFRAFMWSSPTKIEDAPSEPEPR